MQYVLEEERIRGTKPTVYVSSTIPLAAEHWRFQLAKQGREDLMAQTSFFDAHSSVSTIRPGSIVIAPLSDGQPLDAIAKSRELTKVGVVTKADGGPTFWLLRR